MKQAALSILFPYQDRMTYREIPEESWHDLGLDALTEKMMGREPFRGTPPTDPFCGKEYLRY